MTSVSVTVLDDGETVVVTTGDITQETFDTLAARVTALEALDILLLEG